LIEQYDGEQSGRDETGLGRWVAMTFRGEGDMVTRVVCAVTILASTKTRCLGLRINNNDVISSTKSTMICVPALGLDLIWSGS
jgi:hypothetical protein